MILKKRKVCSPCIHLAVMAISRWSTVLLSSVHFSVSVLSTIQFVPLTGRLAFPVSFPFDMFVGVVLMMQQHYYLYQNVVSSHLRLAIILIRHHYYSCFSMCLPLHLPFDWFVSFFQSIVLPHMHYQDSLFSAPPNWSALCLCVCGSHHHHWWPLIECLCNRVK